MPAAPPVSASSPAHSQGHSGPHREAFVEDELSPPFFKNIGVVFVDVEDGGSDDPCPLCAFAKANPPPSLDPASDAELIKHDKRWGIPHELAENMCLCSEEQESEQHAFHLRCLRAFVNKNKPRFRQDPACPVCEDIIEPKKAVVPADGAPADKAIAPEDDELGFSAEEVGQTGGKKRKREKQNYSIFVHIVQATGLKLTSSDKTMNPVAFVSAFGRTLQTNRGDAGKTYSCVWDECFTFQKSMDIDEFSKETINIRIEDHHRLWKNELIGFVKFQAQQVNMNKDHEFYRQWTPIVNIAGKKKDHEIGMQGKLQVSVCCLSEEDLIANPQLPLHVYDLEVQMWADMEHKKEVKDFDIDGNYLANKLEQKRAEDESLTADSWDIIHLRVYRGEDLPKVDNFGWCDPFVEVLYEGLMDKGKKLKTKTIKNNGAPMWNHEFDIPIVSGAPVYHNRIDLVVKDENVVGSDTVLGRCHFNITDILLLGNDNVPIWKNLYLDLDGKPPQYRGRVLLEFSVEYNAKSARVGSQPCNSCVTPPPTTSYKLEAEVLEGSHLLGDHSDYQVDITWGHSMSAGDSESGRLKGGKVWLTFDSLTSRADQSKQAAEAKSTGLSSLKAQKIVPFLTRKVAIAHDLPAPRFAEEDQVRMREAEDVLTEPGKQVDYQTAKYGQIDYNTGFTNGFTGDATHIPPPKKAKYWNDNTLRIDSLSMMPDIIVYVSKKGSRDSCVGYLRIPVNSLKRPTQSWEHGEDLTIFPNLFDPDNGKSDARCLSLKPLKELYEAVSGFLLLRLMIKPVQGPEASVAPNALPVTRLESIPRLKYRFQCHVYQAKDLASVDPSGLSSPLAAVQINDVVLQSKPKMNTCYPLWFECLTGTVELPEKLQYAPDISVTLYHYKPKSILRFNDPSIFMGKAEITALTAAQGKGEFSAPAWYPLQFEEHQYGDVCVAFRLIPEKDLSAAQLTEVPPSSLDELVNEWDTWAIEVSALAMRGQLAKKLKKNRSDAIFELECWSDVQTFTQSQSDAAGKMTVVIRKPANPTFYSSLNIRIFENKELAGVTSISVDRLLQSCLGWYRLIDLLMRTPDKLSKKAVLRWKLFTRKRISERQQKEAHDQAEAAHKKELLSKGLAEMMNESGSTGSTVTTSRFGYLRDSQQEKKDAEQHDNAVEMAPKVLDEIKVEVPGETAESLPEDHDSTEETAQPAGKTAIRAPAIKPRMVDATGNEVFDNKSVYKVQCEQIEEKDPGNPFETHWRVQCDYERLPLTRDPFSTFEVFTGKDQIHQTFLEKLFARSKHSVGTVRGHFFCYRYSKKHKLEAQAQQQADPLFEFEKYKSPALYHVRVYILRGLQLLTKRGKAAHCDPFVVLNIGDGEQQKSEIKDSTLNPNFYQCFEFPKIAFPNLEQSTLSISVFNDATTFGEELVGKTEIPLENRLFSRQWNEGRKPIERRAIYKTKSGRLAQGFVEVCLEILPLHEAGLRALDYLLSPPVRVPWELRVVLYNTRNVTLKKIYKTEDSMCIVDWCAPPNQSDIKLMAQLTGSKEAISTDVHLRSVDGEGNFNWRTLHAISLPAPEPLCNLKVQVWNVNWNPDDCLAEAVIPLWGFFELARRKYAANPEDPKNWVFRIPKQWVPMNHPQNSDHGEVEMDVELLPVEVAKHPEFIASEGPHGWEEAENSPAELLLAPVRPESSFPWYRVDKQIIWRIKYCWKKSRCCVLSMILSGIMLIVAIAVIRQYVLN